MYLLLLNADLEPKTVALEDPKHHLLFFHRQAMVFIP
jgi:hypothetical protein